MVAFKELVMLRILISAVFAVVLSAGVLLAEEVKAKIKSVEPRLLVVHPDIPGTPSGSSL